MLTQEASFYLICPLGLETHAAQELLQKSQLLGVDLKLEQITQDYGGLSFSYPMGKGLLLNHYLKIPVRLLLRITHFKTRDFPTLYKKVQAYPWGKILSHPAPQFKISAHESRLMHTGRMEETLTEAFKQLAKDQPFSNRYEKLGLPPETLFVRIANDEMTFSLDTTGGPLYKRGQHTHKSIAPLRENLAYALWSQLSPLLPPEIEVIDPMCGSGTLLFEGLEFFSVAKRSFAYETTALVKGFHPPKPKDLTPLWTIKQTWGLDLDTKIIEEMGQGLIDFQEHDLFMHPFFPAKKYPRVLMCNPPYGERIALPTRPAVYYSGLIKQLKKYEADFNVALIPEEHAGAVAGHSRSSLSFNHGGIRLKALFF